MSTLEKQTVTFSSVIAAIGIVVSVCAAYFTSAATVSVKIENLQSQITEDREDRKEMKKDIKDIVKDVSYLRGLKDGGH